MACAQSGYGLLEDWSYGPIGPQNKPHVEVVDDDELPVVALDEVREHASAESCWICYGGIVFDVTKFLGEHPVR
jgi:cytochrome b involved in lipid metabolism